MCQILWLNLNHSLTQQELRRVVDYDPVSGLFTNKVWRGGTSRIGTRAGSCRKNGYRHIDIGGKRFFEHALAWFWVHGELVTGIDHINGHPANNAIANLRLANQHQNQQNRRRPNKNNRSGYLGVSWHKQESKWTARITVGGTYKSLGLHDTKEQAYAAYLAAKVKHHPYQTIVPV